MVLVFGVLNVTADSFSDGGRYLEPAAAVARGRQLVADGADVVDVGAESSHPDAEDVPLAEELRRLSPVVSALLAEGVRVSVDTVKPPVMRAMAELGVHYLNDVRGFRDPEAIAAAALCQAGLVVMFSRSPDPRARRLPATEQGLLGEQRAFFADRITALEAAGITRSRLLLDPGLGFFLGEGPGPSLSTLRHLRELRADPGLPLLVAPSRKSFLGAVTGRPVAERGPASLAAELWAALQGCEAIRTHEPRPLRDGWKVLAAIQGRS